MSKADTALAAKAKKNGTSFKSRKAATAAFKKKNATKYTSNYKSKPATRPNHIPQTTSVGGRNVNVTYNVGHGGYGYMGVGGWVMYSVMADVAMTNALMRNQGYAHPGMYRTSPVIVHHTGYGFFTYLMIIGGVIVLLCVGTAVVRRTSLD